MRARHLLALAALVGAIALTVSRLGLVAHELIGHGAAAEAMGSDVSAWGLFWFGGGWIRYDHPGPLSAAAPWVITLGGIAVELTLAAGCALLARRAASAAGLALAAAAWGLAIHGGWYLAAGAFHGFGDGAVLHRALGEARAPVALAVGAACVAAAWGAGRGLGARLRALAPASTPRRQLAAIAAAVGLGLGAHAALTAAELAVRADPTYRAVMRTEGERAAARDVAIAVDSAERAGQPLDAAAVARARQAARRRHRQLPFGPALIGAIGLAAAVGVARPRRGPAAPPAPPSSPPSGRAVAAALAAAAAAVALVAVLDALGP